MIENIRLIIVDDEEQFLELMLKRLKKRGINALSAGDGKSCLSILEQQPIDVVVTDVKMPNMNGIELLSHIKKKYPDIEVILLTGHLSTSDGIEGIKLGAFDYLSKPVEFDHLLSKIKQAYEKELHQRKLKKEAEFRKNIEQQMVVTERLAALGTLATGVAHEINNPLAIIRESAGWMTLILNKEEMAQVPRKDDLFKALDRIEKGVDRTRRITHQLLSFNQKNDSAVSEIDLADLLEESLVLLKREAKNKNVDIEENINDDAKVIFSDPYQLRQVMINLITNAIHATEKGGRITLGLKAIDGSVLLTIADSGCGIPPENLDKIFEPFFTTKSPGKGTGLGLFVTRSIVERLGGEISVDSQLGQGTSFSITLPKSYQPRNPRN